MSQLAVEEICDRVGPARIVQLVAGFYQQVPTDDILGPMYPPEDLAGAEARLCGFLLYRFGGPQDYITQRGHPRLRMRHAPFAITQAARDRWLVLMTRALDQQDWPVEVRQVLEPFLADTASMLINTPD